MAQKRSKAKPWKSLATKLREARLNLHIQTAEAEKWRLELLTRGEQRDALRRSQKELEAKVRRLDEKIDDLVVTEAGHIAALADALDAQGELVVRIEDRDERINMLAEHCQELRLLLETERRLHCEARAALGKAIDQRNHLMAYLDKEVTLEGKS